MLHAIEEERLQANAARVGAYLNRKLIELAARYPRIIGCIHGHGLYQGIEVVDGWSPAMETATEEEVYPPGTEIAYAVCDRLRELGVRTLDILFLPHTNDNCDEGHLPWNRGLQQCA